MNNVILGICLIIAVVLSAVLGVGWYRETQKTCPAVTTSSEARVVTRTVTKVVPVQLPNGQVSTATETISESTEMTSNSTLAPAAARKNYSLRLSWQVAWGEELHEWPTEAAIGRRFVGGLWFEFGTDLRYLDKPALTLGVRYEF